MKYAPQMYGCAEGDLEIRQLEVMRALGSKGVPYKAKEHPIPRLEYGRWLCDCPCGSGAGITRKGNAHCFECGRIMKVAKWPDADTRGRVEDALKERPEHEQHWNTTDPEPKIG
jgi:hypothetical protein